MFSLHKIHFALAFRYGFLIEIGWSSSGIAITVDFFPNGLSLVIDGWSSTSVVDALFVRIVVAK